MISDGYYAQSKKNVRYFYLKYVIKYLLIKKVHIIFKYTLLGNIENVC